MIKTSKKSIVVIVGIILILTTVLFLFSIPQKTPSDNSIRAVPIEEKAPVFILEGGKNPFEVSIADSEEERAQGLSGVLRLPSQTGKLFVFESPGMYGFWMKDMNFPLDIVWIDESFTIVGITQNATPESYPEVFFSPKEVRYVLEINSGEAVENNLSLGSIMKLIKK
jgi:uncharacterized protein